MVSLAVNGLKAPKPLFQLLQDWNKVDKQTLY